jgi:hypothetical protein
MEPSTMTDKDLLTALHEAQRAVTTTSDDVRAQHAAWQEVIKFTRELEGRYPPVTEPTS